MEAIEDMPNLKEDNENNIVNYRDVMINVDRSKPF